MVIYDKLKNLKTEEEQFNFICPHCKANGMKKGVFQIKPLNVSWKPDLIKNKDILNIQIRKGYDALPTLRKALMIASNKNSETNNLLVICLKCNQPIPLQENLSLASLRKWINKNLDEYLDLVIDKEDRPNGRR